MPVVVMARSLFCSVCMALVLPQGWLVGLPRKDCHACEEDWTKLGLLDMEDEGEVDFDILPTKRRIRIFLKPYLEACY